MHWDLQSVIAGTICAFFILLELTLIGLIWNRTIDLSRLISEPNGDASMSRFQLLIFTFVIALSLFLVIVGSGKTAPAFPKEIPAGILSLLGISASSYLVSKGIQFSNQQGVEDRPPDVTVSPKSTQLSVSGSDVQFAADVTRTDNKAVHWSIDPKVGEIDAESGRYIAPKTFPAAKVTHVQVTATSAADANGKGTASIVLINPQGADPEPQPPKL